MIDRPLAAVAMLCAVLIAPVRSQAQDRILTGPERGTYIAFGRDLAGLAAEPAGIHLAVISSRGSSDNVQRLRDDPSARLAMMQSDVYQAFLDEAASGNGAAADLVAPLRVVMPLYLEEIYFVVRADSPMTNIGDIGDKRINVSEAGSGTAISATTIYNEIFGTGIAEKNASFYSNEEALRRLVDDRSLDVVAIVAGQPAPIFSNMRPEARKFIKLLRLDPDSAAARATSSTYVPSLIRASSYPAWATEDVPTLGVRALLVTNNQQTRESRRLLERLAVSLCENFPRLRSLGHAKWNEVSLTLPTLNSGWYYYEPTRQRLAKCKTASTDSPASTPLGH